MRLRVGIVAVAALLCASLVVFPRSALAQSGSRGEVIWGLEAETTSGWCLPQAQLAASGIIVANAIYDTLVTLNAAGEYVPYLAKSVMPNATYDQWTIELRDGVRFHDGSTLTADVVKLNLDTYRGVNPRIPARLTPFVFDNIADVQVTGPLALVVTTKTPWPAFPAVLFGSGRHGIMAAAQLADPATCATNLIGTGPFEKQEWRVNEQFVAVRNSDYWRRGYPRVDRIAFRPVTDASARLSQFESGALDVMHTTSIDNIVALRDEQRRGRAQLFESRRGGEVAYVMLNAARPPFDDIVARRAVAYARDTAQVNQIRNRGIPELANGPFGPGTIGHVADSGLPDRNARKARALVARYEAQHGTKLAFEFVTIADPDTLAIAELVKEQAAAFGVDVTIRTVDQSTLVSEALAGHFQAMGFRNHAGTEPDTQRVWWYSTSPLNFGRIHDPEIDRLLDAGRAEIHPVERTHIYEDLSRRFGDQAWNLWSWYTVWAVAAKPDVRGVLGPPLPDGGGRPAFLGGFVPVLGERRT